MLWNVWSEVMLPCGFIRRIPDCWDHLTRCSAALRLPTLGTPLTRYSASLRLPPSLPLMSPFGLPSAGYPASARWHVFAPAELIRRISRPAPPSELPCSSLSRPSPKVSIRPSGQPSVARCYASLRLPTLGYTFVSPLESVRYRAGVLAPAPALDCLSLGISLSRNAPLSKLVGMARSPRRRL